MEKKYNMKSPAVKRLMREASEMRQPTEDYHAQPLEENLFEWHFTVRGPKESDFDLGIYHGRIILPPEYPMKPPSIILLTPNGRFEINKKICLSISGHHPESWQPSWSIRTVLLAIIGFMPTPGNGAIGSLDYTPQERIALAQTSWNWNCHQCGRIKDFVLERGQTPNKTNIEDQTLAAQISFKGEPDKNTLDSSSQLVFVDQRMTNHDNQDDTSTRTSQIESHDSRFLDNLSHSRTRAEGIPGGWNTTDLRDRQPLLHDTSAQPAIASLHSNRSSGTPSMIFAIFLGLGIVALLVRRILFL